MRKSGVNCMITRLCMNPLLIPTRKVSCCTTQTNTKASDSAHNSNTTSGGKWQLLSKSQKHIAREKFSPLLLPLLFSNTRNRAKALISCVSSAHGMGLNVCVGGGNVFKMSAVNHCNSIESEHIKHGDWMESLRPPSREKNFYAFPFFCGFTVEHDLNSLSAA